MFKAVRTNTDVATPFLRSIEKDVRAVWTAISDRCPTAVDIGCGNGRNSRWLEERDWNVLSFDRQADYSGAIRCNFEAEDIPVMPGAAALVLLQYIVMFLPKVARERLVRKAFGMVGPTGIVVVEVMPVKQCLMSHEDCVVFMEWVEKTAYRAGFELLRRRGKFHVAFVKTNA